MKAIINLWNRFWFASVDPLPAACFRISIGVLMLVMFLALYPNWERNYGPDGVMSLSAVNLVHERPRESVWCVFYWTDGIVPTQCLWWVGFAAVSCFWVGWNTRIATIVLYAIQASMVHRCPVMTNGEDLVFRTVLLYACFAPLGRCLSIDSWLARRKARRNYRDEPPLPSGWALRLIQVNVALIYVISLPYKFAQDSAWVTGDALHWTLASDMWGPAGFHELSWMWGGAIRKTMTYGAVLIEGLFPILVCFRRTRMWALAAITSLHLGIALFIPNVTYFTLAMVCCFWVYVPGETIRSWARALRWDGMSMLGSPRTDSHALYRTGS